VHIVYKADDEGSYSFYYI